METVYRRSGSDGHRGNRVLEAAGIDPETPSYEEVETNEFIARFFWGLIQKKSRIFVLGDTEEELQTLQKYLTETYPGIEIGGGAVVETLEESAFDSLVNEINSQTTDVIVSGLAERGRIVSFWKTAAKSARKSG